MQLLHVKQSMHLLEGDEEPEGTRRNRNAWHLGAWTALDDIEEQHNMDLVRALTTVHDARKCRRS
jgi:hypothetical protein